MILKNNIPCKRLIKIVFTLGILWCAPLFAVNTLAESSDALQDITGIIVKFMWAACIIVGLILLIAGFSHFQAHRQNPKLTPMTTPILYIILGICTIGIPFAEHIFGINDGFEEEDQISAPPIPKRNEPPSHNPSGYIDIDKPIR